MTDGQVYLEKLSAFSRLLHGEGLPVSPQETADACKILIELGLHDRHLVKTALRTVYAKSREDQIIFDRIFEEFFLPESIIRDRNEHLKQEVRDQHRKAEEGLQLNGQPMNFTLEEKMAYGAMDEENRKRLQEILKKYADAASRNPELYENFIRSIFSRAILEQQMKMEDEAFENRMEEDPELGLLYRDICEFQDSEIPKAVSLIQRVTRSINGELSAKGRRGRSHELDFRRTIRKGLETGGSFNRLKYRKKHSRRKNLVLLCDVSGSMIQFSEFALRFIQSLDQASESSRVFLFSETLHEADRFDLQNLDRFRNYVRDTGLYGKGTDLAQALEKLNAEKPAVLNSATTLLILSDTKTTNQKRALKALRESKSLAGQVLILNPIPQRKWKYLPSAQTFGAAVPMASCATLKELADACRKLMLS